MIRQAKMIGLKRNIPPTYVCILWLRRLHAVPSDGMPSSVALTRFIKKVIMGNLKSVPYGLDILPIVNYPVTELYQWI